MRCRPETCLHLLWNLLGLQVLDGWRGSLPLQSCSLVLLIAAAAGNVVSFRPNYVDYFARLPASAIVVWVKYACMVVAVVYGLAGRCRAGQLTEAAVRCRRMTGVSLGDVCFVSVGFLFGGWFTLIALWLAHPDWFVATSAAVNFCLFAHGVYLSTVFENSRRQFRRMNEELETRLASSVGKQRLSPEVWKTLHLHGCACELAAKLNGFLGPLILSQVVFAFTQILSTLYMAVVSAQHSKGGANHVRKCFVYTNIEWVIFFCLHVVQFLHIIVACQRLYNEAEKAVHIFIFQWVLPDHLIDRNEVETVLLKLHQHTVRYTAWDLLSIDMKLVTKISSAIIVYLTILMQFQDQDGCHNIIYTTELHN